jgi:hypothetical protein
MLAINPELKTFDEGFNRSKKYRRILAYYLSLGHDCLVIEIAHCFEEYRRQILKYLARKCPGINILWIYFENNRKAADSNCRLREGGKRAPRTHARVNKRLSANYTIPKGVVALPIHRLKRRPK